MNYTIKRYKGNWLVSDNNGGWVGFNDHDSAMAYAYEQGATEVTVRYSSAVSRIFSREAIKNFNLA